MSGSVRRRGVESAICPFLPQLPQRDFITFRAMLEMSARSVSSLIPRTSERTDGADDVASSLQRRRCNERVSFLGPRVIDQPLRTATLRCLRPCTMSNRIDAPVTRCAVRDVSPFRIGRNGSMRMRDSSFCHAFFIFSRSTCTCLSSSRAVKFLASRMTITPSLMLAREDRFFVRSIR